MIVIIGAGLAGLACATRLEQAGADWLLLESSVKPGGRVATHVTPDGYRLDHGFQVLLDSYPAARQLLDLDAMNPCFFKSGALLAGKERLGEILNPLVHPEGILKTLGDRSIPWSQKVSFALYGAGILFQGGGGGLGISALEDLRRHGLEGAVLERFLRPFFEGVFLDKDLGTDASVLRAAIRNFALGRALLPAQGMGEIPRQMASRLPSVRQRYASRAESLVHDGGRVVAVILESGERIPCQILVIATEEPAARRLLGLGKGRPWQSVTTLYFTGEEPLYEGPYLVLPEGKDRLVRHFCDLTNVAPSYAPHGRRLLTATVLSLGEGDPVSRAVSEIAAIFPAFSEWKFLERIDIPWALPSQSPGFAASFPERRQGPNCWLAWDQVARASIDSALASGLRAADELLPTIF